jgi:hypothetical protein
MADQAHQRDRSPLGILIGSLLRPAPVSLALTVTLGTIVCDASRAEAQAQRVLDSTVIADTIRSGAADDTTAPVADTAALRPELVFQPMHRVQGAARRAYDRVLAGIPWPMAPLEVTAAGDLADWLLLIPMYDVDDAPGAGQNRFFTRWGLAERVGNWQVDGRPLAWQRVTFPQRAQFDAGVVPSFAFSDYRVADRVLLERDTTWGPRPRSSYFARQGDFSDTYSQAQIRQTFRERLGLDLGFAFFGGDGRFAADNRDLRYLHLQLGGALGGGRFWNYRYTQFRDKTTILTPEPFTTVHPQRDDLLWQMEASVYRPAGEHPGWNTGITVQSGKQELSDPLQGYSLKSRDRLWSLWTAGSLRGWFIDGNFSWEELLIDSVNPNRWSLSLAAGHQWRLRDIGDASVSVKVADWDTDPMALEVTAIFEPDTGQSAVLPMMRIERVRWVPTLFDRRRPQAEYGPLTGASTGLLYSEQGDPGLRAQWTNALSWRWGREHLPDGSRTRLTLELHCAYVQQYLRWEGGEVTDTTLGTPAAHYRYGPIAGDARTAGLACGVDGPLFATLIYSISYCAQYVETLEHRRLPGYYPHKGIAMLSWVAPHWRYGADLRINATGIWWYGDRRIDPTGYASAHAFRFDLSGSATIKDFTFSAQMQNVAGFPYRTQAGYPFTGRMLRFGIDWHFLD